jgi:hypothetical protein
VNPTLALLLSTVYDGALAPEHHDDLAHSGLTTETIRAHFIRAVPPTMLPTLLGFPVAAIRSALLFPFRSPDGGFFDHIRLKVFPPFTDARGRAVKYLGPKDAPPRLYFTTGSLPALPDARVPLWVVEGAKKALAVGQLGLPAIGFEGIEGWHAKGTSTLLPDFEALALSGRTIELLPDGDWQTNPNVARGVRRFSAALGLRGAQPRIVVLPDLPDRLEAHP